MVLLQVFTFHLKLTYPRYIMGTLQKENMHYLFQTEAVCFSIYEMVKEWNGASVHISELNLKQPQLEPNHTVADPQGLQHARPARLELPTPDLLPENPITTSDVFIDGDRTAVYVVTQPNSGILVNDVVRLMSIKSNLSSSTTALQISIQALELSTTLQSSITSTDTSLAVVDNLGFYRDGGYVVIEKINSTTGLFENEVFNIQHMIALQKYYQV